MTDAYEQFMSEWFAAHPEDRVAIGEFPSPEVVQRITAAILETGDVWLLSAVVADSVVQSVGCW